jgi:hypothetical protein
VADSVVAVIIAVHCCGPHHCQISQSSL